MKSRLAPLLADGLKEKDALLFQASIMAFTVGWVGYEQSPAMHEYLAKIIDFNSSFEGGLQALIRGFADHHTGLIQPPKKQLRAGGRLAVGRGG